MTDEKKVCPYCKGAEWLYVGMNVRPCVCLRKRILALFLGPELATSNYLPGMQSPLYKANEKDVDQPPTVDRTKENLVLRCRWEDVLPHLRLALSHQWWLNQDYRFRVETDERLFNVWIGNEHYKSRSTTVRDHQTSYNSLRDLIEEYNLVIIRLGFMAHRNSAVANVLKEALMLREVALRPTWVILPPDESPHSWNEDVRAYTVEHFATVDLSKRPAAEREYRRPTATQAPAIAVEDEDEAAERPLEASGNVPALPGEDGPAGFNKPGRGRTWTKKRRNEGGGPV